MGNWLDGNKVVGWVGVWEVSETIDSKMTGGGTLITKKSRVYTHACTLSTERHVYLVKDIKEFPLVL